MKLEINKRRFRNYITTGKVKNTLLFLFKNCRYCILIMFSFPQCPRPFPPPYTPNFVLLLSLWIRKKYQTIKITKNNKAKIKIPKQIKMKQKAHGKAWSLVCIGQLLQGAGAAWKCGWYTQGFSNGENWFFLGQLVAVANSFLVRARALGLLPPLGAGTPPSLPMCRPPQAPHLHEFLRRSVLWCPGDYASLESTTSDSHNPSASSSSQNPKPGGEGRDGSSILVKSECSKLSARATLSRMTNEEINRKKIRILNAKENENTACQTYDT